jgi:hypothetical protein
MQEGETEVEAAAPRRRWPRVLFALAAAAFVGIWGYAFWYEANRPNPEPLDATSLRAATEACHSALVSLKALPQLPTKAVPTPAARSALVHSEDVVLNRLVDRLGVIRPTDHSGATALTDFTADWRHLVESRERYTKAIFANPTTPKLYIPVAPTGEPITIRMGEYADIHKLIDCTPDSLQGEIVEGARTYPRVG